MTETLIDELEGSKPQATYHDENTRSRLRHAGTTPALTHDADHNNGSGPPFLSPEVTPTNVGRESADVTAMVLKAKKAAQFLWVLIHAQNCRFPADRCSNKGCADAKRLLLHIKTCAAGNNGCLCPGNYNGCQQARKLLHHYQKCREIRAKQAGMGRRGNNHQHVCLVCSLVARHARNVLEGPSRKSSTKKQVIASFKLAEPGPEAPAGLNRSWHGESTKAMPPPPPRQPGTISVQPNRVSEYSGSDSSDDGTPGKNQLMLFSEVAAAAAPPSNHEPPDQILLGKSLDSSKSPFLTFAASALQSLKRSPHDEEAYVARSQRRSRAESYDERALHGPSLSDPDPTLELDLKGEQNFDTPPNQELVTEIVTRRRSASLGVLASACLTRKSCDTIAEEHSDTRDDFAFPMDEDGL